MWHYGRGSPRMVSLQRLRGSGASVSARAGSGQGRLGSNATRQLLLPVLQRVAAEHSEVLGMISCLISYTICMYDVSYVLIMIS